MQLQTLIRTALVLSLGSTFAFAAQAPAQEVSEVDDARGAVELRAEVKEAVERDTDVANTALVFNNVTRSDSYVVCTAYDGDGKDLGTRRAYVPRRGVRYLRASDLSGGVDFVGSALCTSRHRMVASAVFLGPGAVTNLDVIQPGTYDATRIRFPLIATY
ncbi:MAG: hypothetical protein AB8G23_14995 [Myxococcota bacterium]